jgi:hypothetical protein
MKNIENTFFKSIEVFQRLRLKSLEQEYNKLHRDPENNIILNDLYRKIFELLGEHNNLLIEYSDRLIAKYSNDPLWFYDSGFQDCQALSQLFGDSFMGIKQIPPLEEKTHGDFVDELFGD